MHGALVEPMSVAYRAVLRAEPRPGDAAVVFGGGPIGIGAYLALARARRRRRDGGGAGGGAPRRGRRASAPARARPGGHRRRGGCARPHEGCGRSRRRRRRRGPASFTAALGVARTGGRVVTVAAYMEPVTYNPTDVMIRELEIVSSFSYNGEFDAVIEHMAAGRLPDRRVGRAGAVRRAALGAYDRLHRGEAIKLMIDL